MTREEKQKAINALKISAPVKAVTQEEFNDYIQTLNRVMDWLEQEPCEDAISREELKKMFREKCVADCSCCKYWRGDDWCGIINDAPSVQPKHRTGTWRKDIDNSRRWDRVRFYCSECGSWQTYGETDYCPSCGAKMKKEKT